MRQLAARALLVTGEGAEPVEVLFYAAATRDELARLPELRRAIRPDGAIWVVFAKGKAATVKETEVITAARGYGLVDSKVVSFSASHTALKLVVPVAARSRGR